MSQRTYRMNLDALFSKPVQSNADLALAIRSGLNDLRRRPMTFAAGCGCAVSFSAISVRDFEEALVFHVTETWRASRATPAGDDAPALPEASQIRGVDELLDQVMTLDRVQTATQCRGLLEDISRSLTSFVQQCSTHRLKAENV
jgi:hypothetical protein